MRRGLGKCVCAMFLCGCFVDDGQVASTSSASATEPTGTLTSDTADTMTAGLTGETTDSPTTETGETTDSSATDTTATSDTSETTTDTTGTDTSPGTTATGEPTTSTTDTQSTTDDPTGGLMCDAPFDDCNNLESDGCEADLSSSKEHCGACDNPCDGPCVDGECQAFLYAFVTSERFPGDLNGVAGADGICNEAAAAANLPGHYLAWLSTVSTSPATRFSKSTLPYRMPNEQILAANWAELTEGELQNRPNITEFGSDIDSISICLGPLAWTCTQVDGSRSNQFDCEGWTISSDQYVGAVGNPHHTDENWTDGCTMTCSSLRHLYCFQQL